jgi:hypothetical protein
MASEPTVTAWIIEIPLGAEKLAFNEVVSLMNCGSKLYRLRDYP